MSGHKSSKKLFSIGGQDRDEDKVSAFYLF
jgi:hypothetical protein